MAVTTEAGKTATPEGAREAQYNKLIRTEDEPAGSSQSNPKDGDIISETALSSQSNPKDGDINSELAGFSQSNPKYGDTNYEPDALDSWEISRSILNTILEQTENLCSEKQMQSEPVKIPSNGTDILLQFIMEHSRQNIAREGAAAEVKDVPGFMEIIPFRDSGVIESKPRIEPCNLHDRCILFRELSLSILV